MTEDNQSQAAHEIVVRVSNSRRTHASIIAGLLAVMGLGSFFLGEGYFPDSELIGMVCGGLAAAILFVSRGAWTEGVAMTIGEEGVWYRDWKIPVVPWQHVGRAYATGIRLRPLLRIDLLDMEGFVSKLDDESRHQVGGNTLVKANHLLIPHGALELPISELAAAINAAVERRAAG